MYSGINASLADRKAGKNEHLHTYKVDYPSKGEEKRSATISQLSKTSLFSPSYCNITGDPFQRLLRLSPVRKSVKGNKRIAAIANSLAPESEIIILNATTASPSNADVIQRIRPIQNAEANDIDIIEGNEEGDFLVAYCTQYEVYLSTVSYDFASREPTSPIEDPNCLHSAPLPDATKKGRSKYRNLRFITPEHILLLSNAGARSELQILRIHAGASGEVILRKRLPRNMGVCVSMDVTILDADAITGATQVIVAVAAQAEDITVFTLDYAGPIKNTASSFATYKELTKVHQAPMKKSRSLSFSQTADQQRQNASTAICAACKHFSQQHFMYR